MGRSARLSWVICCVLVMGAQAAWAWPDLRVVKSGATQAAPGDLLTYTLAYSNAGPVKSTSVVLKDFLPGYVTVMTNSLIGGSLASNTISWSLGTVNSGTGGSKSFQVLVNANAPAGGFITNRSQVFGAEAEETGKTNDNFSALITKIIGPPPPENGFCRAILAKQPVSLHGTMLIDSFNSLNPSRSTNGRYDPAKRGDGGNVASISDSLTVITDTGNTKVYGRFETGPAGAVTISGQASVGSLAWVNGGNRGIQPGWQLTNLNAVISDVPSPSLTFTSLPQTSGTVNGTNYTYVLNTGNYSQSSDLTLSSSQKMLINGNVVLYFQKKLAISGQAYIYVSPGSKLTVYLADTTSLSGGGTVNGTGFASNCAYLGLPSCTSVSFSGNSDFIGTVYAPQAAVQMSGGGSLEVNFIGAAVAKAVDISGNYQFHFDEGLCRECSPPQVVLGTVSVTNCPGTAASFSVAATGTGLSYAWFKSNAALSGQTNSTFTIPNVSTGDAGTYRVVVTGACGGTATNTATLTVNAPTDASVPSSLVRTTGSSATFNTVASGSGPFNYVWSKDNTVLNGQIGSSLTINNIIRSDAGTYSVEVSGACGSVIRSGTLTVQNSAPVAMDDAYAVLEDTLLTVSAPGVLANDSDPDGDPLTAILVSGPAHGTLTLNPNGSFTYRPATNYHDPDSFAYKASDGTTNSGPVNVTLTVNTVNDAPAASDDNYSATQNLLLTVNAPGVLANDTDVENDPLTAVQASGPTHGTLSLNPNGSFTYLPATNYHGPDSFTYRANDGMTHSGIATVSINVAPRNLPPVANPDSYPVDEDTPLTVSAPGLLGNDLDFENDPLTALLVSGPAHGTLTLNPNGSFTYRPATNYHGPDSFVYMANDGTTNSGPATVTLTVNAVNDAPTPNPDSYSLNEDTLLTVSTPGVLANDTDVDGDPLTATLVSGPAHGTLTLNSNGSFSYRPATNYNGPDSFIYKASDRTTNSDLVAVILAVNAVNDPPSFTRGQDQLVLQNAGPQSVPNWATNISPGPADEAGQTVSFVLSVDNRALFATPPAISANGVLTYTPAANAYGVARVTVVAKDDGGTANGGQDTSPPVTLTLTVNSPPLVSIVTPTNGSTFFSFQSFPYTAAASDPDGAIGRVWLFLGTNVAATFTNPPYSTTLSNLALGSYQLVAQAVDNFGALATSSVVNVSVLDAPPVIAGRQEYNFQVTLAEQSITVFNPTPYPLSAVRVLVSNLQPGVRVHNASGTNASGIPYVLYNQVIPPFASAQLAIEYFTPLVQTVTSKLTAEVVPIAPPLPALPAGNTMVPLKRVVNSPDGRVLIGFDSIPSRLYYVEYSDDLITWKPTYPAVTASGVVSQWVDNGCPKTDCHPALLIRRFYRVRMTPGP